MPLFFTPNPCIERTLFIEDFARGRSHRVVAENLRVTAGGKGINAARVAHKFGAPARLLAPIGRGQITQFRALLESDALEHDLIEVAPDTRTATNIVHAHGFTEIVEAGGAFSVRDGEILLERFEFHLANCELAIIGGSYPPPAPDCENAWLAHGARLCEAAARAGKRVLYDGKGAQFACALRSSTPPWAIKPNLVEASELLNRDLESPGDERNAARELLRMGVEVVLLSCGARGLWFGCENQIEWIEAPAIEEISPVGSGDSLVGAFIAHWLQSGDIYQSARWGVAAGSANAARLEAAQIGPQEAQVLFDRMAK